METDFGEHSRRGLHLDGLGRTENLTGSRHQRGGGSEQVHTASVVNGEC